jgi:hypothetical protein
MFKVHNNEKIFGSDFEFCSISLLVMLKYYGFVTNKKFIGGGTIIPLSLKTKGNQKNVQDRPKNFFLNSYLTLL